MMSRFFFAVSLLGLACISAPTQAATRARPSSSSLVPIIDWLRHKEAIEMLTTILRGDLLQGGSTAWFHPGQSVYSWDWLVRRFDADHDGVIEAREWPGSRYSFERLDRSHDGCLTAMDFDWSDQAPLNRQIEVANQLFRRADSNDDEKLTAEEWQRLFEKAAGEKKTLTRKQLHVLLFPPPFRGPSRMAMPSRATLLSGLLSGEIGSPLEGPEIGQTAPDFELFTHDGKRLVSLRSFRGRKPVALVFGSFT